MRALRLLAVVLVALGAAWAALPAISGASPEGRISSLQDRISSARDRLDRTHGRAVLLTTDISGFNARIATLQRGITRLEGRQAILQADLDAKRAELARIQAELETARGHLARLRSRLAYSRRVLAARLVQLYEAGQPDLVTVVLDAHGFSDLLENGTFLRHIGAQDRRIVEAVQTAKDRATALARRLAALEARQQRVTAAILARRNEVAQVKQQLVERRSGYARARAVKAAALDAVNATASKLRQHVDVLKGEVAKIQQKIQAAAAQQSTGGAALPAGPIRGGGSLIWPVNGPITSPFCERRAWEACHPGIDIGVPAGTPIRAAATGTVSIAGPEGGYGNYTCIQHAGPLSTCYGHQSSIGVSVGQHVTQGQVIGLSGCTGLCFGDHLHFETRINGSVVDPMGYLG